MKIVGPRDESRMGRQTGSIVKRVDLLWILLGNMIYLTELTDGLRVMA